MNRTGVLRCLAAAVLFGASAPAASELAGKLPTLVLAGLLYVGAALAGLAEAGAQLIDEAPRPGLFGLEVAFVHPDAVHGVLTEVVSPA